MRFLPRGCLLRGEGTIHGDDESRDKSNDSVAGVWTFFLLFFFFFFFFFGRANERDAMPREMKEIPRACLCIMDFRGGSFGFFIF